MKALFFLFLLFLHTISYSQDIRLMMPVGHTKVVSTAVFSPDGKMVLTASTDKTAKLWDAQTGYLLADLKGHTGEITSASFSAGGDKILTSSGDGTTRIWDSKTGNIKRVLQGHNGGVSCARFHPDGKRIATASEDYSIMMWNADSGELLDEFSVKSSAFEPRMNSVMFSPDGGKIVAASSDKLAIIWDLKTGDTIQLKGHRSGVNYAEFSPDNSKVITSSDDSTSIVWDAASGKILKILTAGNTEILKGSAGFSPDGTKIITAGNHSTFIWNTQTWKRTELNGVIDFRNGTPFNTTGKKIITYHNQIASVWDTETGKLLFELKGHSLEISSALFSADGKKIITGSRDRTAKTWDANGGGLITDLRGYSHTVYSTSLNPDNTQILAAFEDQTAKSWDLSRGYFSYELKGYDAGIYLVKFSPDGSRIVTLYNDTTAKLWDGKTGQFLFDLGGHGQDINTAEFSPDGKTILTSENGGHTYLWDVRTGKLLFTISVPLRTFSASKFNSDGTKILTLFMGDSIRIWDAKTGRLLKGFGGLFRGITLDGSFSPDDRKIVTADFDYVTIWDAGSGKMIAQSKRIPATRVRSADFTPDGKKIVVTFFNTFNKTFIKILDANNGEVISDLNEYDKVAEVKGHSDAIRSIAFSPDGTRLATASADNSAKVWDLKTNSLLLDLKGHFNSIKSIRYSHDGQKIITDSEDNTIRVWNARTGELIYTFFSLNTPGYFALLPDGYYKCSQNAARLLHYVTPDLKVITFDQLDVKFNRPDLVLEKMGSKDTSLMRAYRLAYIKRIQKLNIDTGSFRDQYSVPECDFVNRSQVIFDQAKKNISLTIKGTDKTYPLDRFNVWVNEVPVFGTKGINVRRQRKNSFDTTIVILLSSGLNRIETSVMNVNGAESYRAPLIVKYTPAQPPKETTYFIGIGINRFADTSNNLKYCEKDIRDLALKLKEKYGNNLETDTLFNENVTNRNVKALKAKLLKSKEDDKVIIAYSGHGLLSRNYDYYLSTYDMNFKQPETRGLPYDELENLVDGLRARKKLMLIDACHSGEVDKEELAKMQQVQNELDTVKGGKVIYIDTLNRRLGMKSSFELMQELFVNVGRGTGTTIISAAAGTQFALERGDLKNGVFTYTILESMSSMKTVTVSDLKKHVSKRVSELTKGLQQPTARNETIEVDWNVW